MNRILDLGDIEGLLEKVETAMDKEQQKKLKGKLEEGKFTLRDFQQQLESMSGMGSFSKLAEMVPGFSKVKDKVPENLLGTQEEKMKIVFRYEYLKRIFSIIRSAIHKPYDENEAEIEWEKLEAIFTDKNYFQIPTDTIITIEKFRKYKPSTYIKKNWLKNNIKYFQELLKLV